MNNGQLKLNGKRTLDVPKSPMLVDDLIQYLSGLAKLHRQDKIGNVDLSNGLRELSKALRPYGDYSITELSDAVNAKSARISTPKASAPRKAKPSLPSNLESISHEDVEKMLDNDDFTKQQIAQLGFQRFGISKSMLQRLRKEDAKRSVRSALDNEKTLDVISHQARKAGKARAS